MKKTLKTLESNFDVEIQAKRDQWPAFHASSIDNRWFFVLTVGAENSWECKRVDVLMHRSELRAAIGLPPIAPVGKFRLSFFRSWGQLTPIQSWGTIDDNFEVSHQPSLDDNVGEESLPPSDGVVAVTTAEYSFCCAYSRIGSVIELVIVDKSEPFLQTYSADDGPKDFGKRVRKRVQCRIDLEKRTFVFHKDE